jgi:hypothetical protein
MASQNHQEASRDEGRKHEEGKLEPKTPQNNVVHSLSGDSATDNAFSDGYFQAVMDTVRLT